MMIYQRGEAREAEFLVTYCILVTASSTMLCTDVVSVNVLFVKHRSK